MGLTSNWQIEIQEQQQEDNQQYLQTLDYIKAESPRKLFNKLYEEYQYYTEVILNKYRIKHNDCYEESMKLCFKCNRAKHYCFCHLKELKMFWDIYGNLELSYVISSDKWRSYTDEQRLEIYYRFN